MEQFCIIHSRALADQAEKLGQDLAKRGAIVCAVEAAADQIGAAKEGASVSAEIAACMKSADVCIFLVEEKTPSSIQLAAQSIGEKKMILLHAAGAEIPQVFSDLAETKIPLGTENSIELICGPSVWVNEKGENPEPRKLVRIRCQ